MKPKPREHLDAAELRRQAELRVEKRRGASPPPFNQTEMQRLVHEMQVHQVELELQNEALSRAHDEVESMLEQYTDLYDFAPVGYLTFDVDGRILQCNFAAARLLGAHRGALVGRLFGPGLGVEDRLAFAAQLQDVFALGESPACEVTLTSPRQVETFVSLAAIRSESGNECRVVMSDITARKQSEQDQLVLGKLESTGLLAGGIAHDFNNLLTVILLDLEQAGTLAPPSGELFQSLEDAKAATWSARVLTQQLITFSKGGASPRRVIHLGELIRRAVRPALSGSNVKVSFALPDDLWAVEVDEGQLEQVFRNVVLNAREAMPGGGTVEVRAENVQGGTARGSASPFGDTVQVTVSDQGVGIAKEVLPQIFDPYFSTKGRGVDKGMGLGLTISHTIIRKHGGTIEVESKIGQGTTVRIRLLASRAVPAEQGAAPVLTRAAQRRVLVMDDEASIRMVVAAALAAIGHEVEVAETGQQAIDLFLAAIGRGRPFELVLLDLTVRDGLGGDETMQVLRQLDPAIRGIVMSGHSVTDAVQNPEQHGFRAFLAKPFNTLQLKDAIARASA